MKTYRFLVLVMAIMAAISINAKQALAQESSISIQVFYDELSPYGQWVEYPNYGYVWIPDGGPDFVPYSSGGYWVLTDYGWTWVSDYSWGWAPFHYGRWDYDNYYGWFWVPDTEWGPSWVVWRSSPGYYGWAPMGPGISINLSFETNYNYHHDYWVFVRDTDFDRRDIHRYYVNKHDNDRIIRSSTVIHKTTADNHRRTTYIAGPERADVQKATGRKINARSIQDNSKPGQKVSNKKLNIYRPQVNKSNNATGKPAPNHASQYKEEKTMPARNVKDAGNNKKQKINNNGNNNAQPAQNRNVNPTENKKQNQPQKGVNPTENNRQSEPKKGIDPAQKNKRNESQRQVNPAEKSKQSEPQKSINPFKKNKPSESKPAKTDKKRSPEKTAPAKGKNPSK
ncbi:MAG: DUF6600 domain-containing protein [Salinivirgaceae bacterium]